MTTQTLLHNLTVANSTVANNVSTNSLTLSGYSIAVVSALPNTPDTNTIYIVVGG